MATHDSICFIAGCGKHVHFGGLCSMHAERKRRHGDPLAGAAKPRGGCSVEGCPKPHYGKGYCNGHHRRWSRYGDPLAGGPMRGEIKAFVEQVIASSTDDCITFPFCRDAFGYGRFNPGSGTVGAHCYVAERVHGPRPSPDHEACHSCGNGHLGCINPRHVYWGTRLENVRDAVTHGTANFFGRKRQQSA